MATYCGPLYYLAECEGVTPAAGGAQHGLVGHAEQLGLVTRQDGITEMRKMQSYNAMQSYWNNQNGRPTNWTNIKQDILIYPCPESLVSEAMTT